MQTLTVGLVGGLRIPIGSHADAFLSSSYGPCFCAFGFSALGGVANIAVLHAGNAAAAARGTVNLHQHNLHIADTIERPPTNPLFRAPRG